MEMTIHRALAELKLLEARIQNGTQALALTDYRKKSSATCMNSRLSIADFTTRSEADLQSVLDLIHRRANIKRAIDLSNAETEVVVAGKPYKVIEAIQRKRAVDYELDLVEAIRQNLTRSQLRAQKENDKMEQTLEKLLNTMAAAESKDSKESNESLILFEKSYRADHEWEVVNQLRAEEVLKAKTEELNLFLAEVDAALSVSNAITTISIED